MAVFQFFFFFRVVCGVCVLRSIDGRLRFALGSEQHNTRHRIFCAPAGQNDNKRVPHDSIKEDSLARLYLWLK
jgi:hypothetical protein